MREKKEKEEIDLNAPNQKWEEERQQKVAAFVENQLFDPNIKDKIKPPGWAPGKYPGMEFNWVPSDPRDMGRYVGGEYGWETVRNPEGKGIDSPDGRIHKGDTVLVMRPVEVGRLVKEREARERDEFHGVSANKEAVDETVREINKGLGRPVVSVKTERSSEVMTGETSPEEMERETNQKVGPKKYIAGYGPSKVFGGNQT